MKYKFLFISMLLILVLSIGSISAADVDMENDLNSEISIADSAVDAVEVTGLNHVYEETNDVNASDSSDVLGVSEEDVLSTSEFDSIEFFGSEDGVLIWDGGISYEDYQRYGYQDNTFDVLIYDVDEEVIEITNYNDWSFAFDDIPADTSWEDYRDMMEYVTEEYNANYYISFYDVLCLVGLVDDMGRVTSDEYYKFGNHTFTIYNRDKTFSQSVKIVMLEPKYVKAEVSTGDLITVHVTTNDGPGNFSVYVADSNVANGTVDENGTGSVSFDKIYGKNTLKVILDGATKKLNYNTEINIVKFLPGSFSDLASLISNAGDVLDLPYNFNLMPGESDVYKNGILVNKSLTINGNGFTINGTCNDSSSARIFDTANNVTLTVNNVSLVNGGVSGVNGGALRATPYAHLILNNVILSDNFGASAGGAINLNNYAALTATNVTFKNNKCNSRGGAIFANTYTNLILTNVVFDSNSANGNGGNIFVSSDSNIAITNGTFKNFYMKANNVAGGAIFLDARSKLNISDSSFENITIEMAGSGRWYSPNNNNGGVIRCEDSTVLNITGTTFKNNKNTNSYGDASSRGIIYSTGSNAQTYITNSEFINNTAQYCGVIYTRNADIIGSVFVDNSGSNDYPEIYYEGNGKGTISHNAFLDNTTVIRLMNSASNIVETNNWWGSNSPADLVRIQDTYNAPNNYIVMTVYNEGNTAYGSLIRDSNGNFIENPELMAVRPAVFEASNTTTVNTNNGVAGTQISDSQVNITIDGQTLTLLMASGNVTSIQIVSVENTTTSADGKIYFLLSGDNGSVDGVLTVLVNDQLYAVEVENGFAIVTLGSDFDAGVYDIYYVYEGGANYAALPSKTKGDKQFEVYKCDVDITIDREKNIVIFNVTNVNGGIPTGTINTTVGNISKTFTLNNGIASYNYGAELAPGTYDVTVTYSGDENNNEGELTTTFDIIKYEVEITFTNVTNTLTFNVTGVNDVIPTGKITVTLGNSTQTLTLNKGIASYDFGKVLDDGEYELSVSYEGDDYYNPGTMEDTFEIVKMMPTIDLTIENLNITKGTNNMFTIRIIGDENIPTGTVVLTIGDKSYSRSLSRTDTLSYYWGNQLDAGSYNVTVTYSGDGYYYSTNITYNESYNVLPKITISAPSEIYSEQAPLKVSIDPIDVNGTLIIKMDGVEIFAGEIDSGSYYMTLSNIEEGEHTFEAFYGGNDKYLPVSASVTSTVSYPELPQWGQAGYDYTNGGQSPYMRLNEVVELWNYTADMGSSTSDAASLFIDADGNVYIVYNRKAISLYNDGTERWITTGGTWGGEVIDAHGVMVTPQRGNAFNYLLIEDGRIPNPWGGAYFGSSSYAPVIGPDGIVYVSYEYSYPFSASYYDPTAVYGDRRWIGQFEWGGTAYNYRGTGYSLILIDGEGLPYGSQPHLAPVTLDNLGNIWHTSTSGLRGAVIGTGEVGFQNANIGTKGRAVVDANNIVYAFGEDDKIYALTMSGVLWNATVSDGLGDTLVVGKDSEYVLSVNSEGVLYKYDVTDGKETKIYDFETTVSNALMTDVNGIIYVGDDDGVFWALKDDGTVLWKFDTGSAIKTRPVMDKDGVIYVYTEDKVLYALGNHKDNSTISLEVNDTTTVDGLTAIATVNENATGDVVFTLNNDKSYKVEIINGTATLFVKDILSGDYNITAVYGGNYAFYGNQTNATFTVTKSNATIEINASEIYVGTNGTVIISIANATGDIAVTIDTLDQYNLTLVDGVANITLPLLEEGKYNVTVNYAGDETFFNATAASEFEVIKYTPEVSIDVADVSVLENATLTVTVTNATGNVTIKVDDDEETVELENGSATVVLDLLPAGVHNITVTYNGDDLFYEAVNETSFNVSKVDTEIEAVAEAGEAFEDVTITVIVNDIATGNVTVTVDGKDYSGEISDSVAEIIVPNLGAGNYTAEITYAGDDKVNENSTSISFTVDKIADYEIETEENLSSIADGTITVTLPEDANGKVAITINNETYTADVVNGTAVVDIPSIIPGDYDYVVAYSDDDNYEDGVSLGSVSIPKEDFELKVTVENDTVIVEVPKSATGYVLVSVDGKGFFAPVENGIATVQTIGLDSGNYTADVIYTGDAVYNPANATASIEIPEEPVVEPEDANMTADVNGSDVGVDLPDDATGYVVVSVDGKDYFFNVTDDIELDLSDLAPGEYPVEITYSGDDKYAPAIANTTVTVPEVPVVEPEDANMTADVNGSDVGVDLPDDATGYVVVSVDGKDYYFDAADDIELDLSDLAPGEYPVEITYSGDDKYAPATANTTVTVPEVLPEDANIAVSVENNTITVTADENATGNVLVDVNGTGYYAPLENGKATIDVIGLDEGTYDATVTYSGDDVYAPDTKNATVTVPKKEEPVTPEPVDPEADISVSNETVSMDLPEDATGYMLVDVDGTGYYVPVKDGKASFDLPELAPGNHTIAVTYTGDKNYAPANATQTIAVEKEVPSVVAENLTKVEKAPDRFEANFTDASGNPLANANVTFEINGGKYTRVTDANGKAGMNINLDAGTYTIVTTNPVTGESVTNTIVVLPRLEGSDLTKYFRNASQYRVKVLDDNGNPAKAGEVVSFNINGVFYNRTTDANGFAQLSINLNPGDYIITAEYKNCRISNNIKVLPILTGKDLTKKFGEAAAFEATLVDGQGKPYANQRVEFNINGVFYYRNTDSNGVAKLNINLQPGEYIITSVYDAAAISNRVTVTA